MKYLIVILFLLNGLSSSAQSVTFNKTYNYGVDGLFNIVQKDSSYYGLIDAGYFPSYLQFTKLDYNGDIVFSKKYGDSTDYYGYYSLIPLNDSTLISGAYLYHQSTLNAVTSLTYFNFNGDTINQKEYYAPTGFDFYSGFINKATNNSIIATGEITDSAVTDGNVFISKIDSAGNFLWHNSYGGNLFDSGVSSIETPDGGFLTLGWTRSFGFGNINNRDMLLVKWDSTGNFVWKKTYGTINIDGGTGISSTLDGNYLLSGYKGTSTNDGRGWIIKIDTAGVILWEQTYGYNTSELWWAKEATDKSIIAVGSITDTVNQKDQGWIIKIDSLGNLLWSRTFQWNNNHSYFRDVTYAEDGGVICAGFVFRGTSNTQDAWLVKLDSLGCDSVGCPNYTSVGIPTVHQKEINFFELYPNPVKENLLVKFTFPMFTVIQWAVYDLQGRVVLNGNEFTREMLSINTTTLQQGLYILKITAEGINYSSMFVKE